MFNKETKYLLLIIIIFIAACIETDIYLPAFTDMMAFFSISEERIQSLLTWNFVGICLSGPFYGPLSDSFGRKKPLLIALGLFLLGSILTFLAENFYLMLLGRILQGLGSGGCFTLGTAIIFDVFQENKAIEAVNKINTIVPFLMAGAPILGGYLNYTFGFRSNFLAILIAVLLSFMICLLFFKETLAKERRIIFQTKKVVRGFWEVLKSIPFWQTTCVVSLVFAGYLTFLSGISVLFVLELGVKKEYLPFHQAALLGAWLCANLLFNKASKKWGMKQIKTAGTLLFATGGIGLFFIALISPQNTLLFTFAMALYSFGANWTQGLYFPEGMELFPDMKGITASLLTSIRLLISAFIVGLTSKLYDMTIFPIAGVLFAVTLTTLVIIFFYEKKKQTKEIEQPTLLEPII